MNVVLIFIKVTFICTAFKRVHDDSSGLLLT
jgi:hypothetical protein